MNIVLQHILLLQLAQYRQFIYFLQYEFLDDHATFLLN